MHHSWEIKLVTTTNCTRTDDIDDKNVNLKSEIQGNYLVSLGLVNKTSAFENGILFDSESCHVVM